MSDLDRLIRFAAVAEELSFSQAARRLHVDQPWLSRQIQQLETQMGFALFVRSTRKVTLTPEGDALFAHARELARVAEDCRRASREMVRAHSVTLAIGVNPYTFWIPERKRIIDSFQARHERVTIEIVSNYTERLLAKLRNRLIDVALIAEPFRFPDLEALVIHESRVGLLVPAEDVLATRGRLSLADLRGRQIPMISSRLNPDHWELIHRPFIDAGVMPLMVQEGDTAVPFYARERRLPMISVGWPHSQQGMLADFVHIALDESAPSATFALVRRREPPRGLLTHFWDNAVRLARDAVPEEADVAVRKVRETEPELVTESQW